MKLYLLSIIILLPIQTILAASQSIEKNLKEHHFDHKIDRIDLEFILSIEQTKDLKSHQSNGLYSTLKSSFLFKLSKNDELRLYGSHVWERYERNEGNATYWELGEFMYRRKNILNESDHFVDMSLELKNYWVMDKEIRKRWGFDGAFIPQVIFKRSLSRNIGLKLKLRRHYYDRNRNTAGVLTKEDRIYLSGSYMFNHWLMLNTELKYRHKIYTGYHFNYRKFEMERKNVEITIIHPSLLVFLNRTTMLETYVETVLNDSTSEKKITEQMKDNQVIGAALYLTAF
jgi:hypothetical protein